MRQVEAAPISPRNPYRSFNIGGVNYGSLRWERTRGHRSATGNIHRSGWLWRRR
ncbi:MAG TPA: hypothetical protein PJ982_00400 [Lacipirellulaceae bacterium]|nr:hypothetical protein [Lacipirellulaceae bacterium]